MSIVGAVIVTYFPDLGHLSKLMVRLAKQVAVIVIVDNTPAEDSALEGWLKERSAGCLRVHLLAQGCNLGVATALNIGMRHAMTLGCTHVLLSDQDSIPDWTMVSALLETEAQLLAKGVRVAAVGPAFQNDIVEKRFRFHIRRASGKWYTKGVPDSSHPRIEVASLITSGMLVSANALAAVGEMLDGLFIDYVDIEWCQRAIRRGYSCFATRDAIMDHRMGDEALRIWLLGWRKVGKYGPLRLYYQFRNSAYLARLPHVDLGFKLIQPWFWLGKIYAYALFSPARLRSLAMMVRGWRDGITGQLGPYRD